MVDRSSSYRPTTSRRLAGFYRSTCASSVILSAETSPDCGVVAADLAPASFAWTDRSQMNSPTVNVSINRNFPLPLCFGNVIAIPHFWVSSEQTNAATKSVLPVVCRAYAVPLGNGNTIWPTAVWKARKDNRKCFITLLQLVQ